MTPEDRLVPTVVASILERDAEATRRRLHESVPRACSSVEIRGDHLTATDLAAAVGQGAEAGLEVIATVRTARDGGAFDGSEDERRRAIVGALAAGARFVDVEVDGTLHDLAHGAWAPRVILSHHGAPCPPDGLRAVYRRMAATPAARLKIVPSAGTPEQAVATVRELLRLAAQDSRPLASFAAGRAGAVTRLLAPAWGSWATYGSTAVGAETAEGQLPARELLETHDVLGIGPKTQLFALVGRAVSASPSPAMHDAAYRDAGLDARYLPLELDSIEDVLPLAGPAGLLGLAALAVTLPFKQAAFARCRETDEISRACRAVNTVLICDRGWSGINTDGPAVLDLVRPHLDPADADVAVVGAGGMARAAAAALLRVGSRVTLYARSAPSAATAAAELGIEAADLATLAGAFWRVLVQATPLGQRGETVVPAEALCGELVLEAVYGATTPLVRDARARGLTVIDGFDLLVAQAVRQCAAMTGRAPDPGCMARAGRAWLEARGLGTAPAQRGA